MMGFKTGDVVVDCYGTKGIVIAEAKYRPEEILLLIKTGERCYGTYQSRKEHWKIIGHFDEFDDILNVL